VLPYANAEAMNLHLGEISRCVVPGAHAVVTLMARRWLASAGRPSAGA
jgi:hypothetical protein